MLTVVVQPSCLVLKIKHHIIMLQLVYYVPSQFIRRRHSGAKLVRLSHLDPLLMHTAAQFSALFAASAAAQ